MKSKIWLLIILILFIITYIYFSNLNENYIEKRKIDYIVGEKGEIQVIQEDIYNVKDYISNINTYLLLPLKDIPIDLEKNSLKFQKLTDVSIEIIDSNNKKIDNNIPSYSNVDRKIYASTYLKEGRYKVITKYTIHNTLTNYDDVCELYTKVLSDKEKMKVKEITFNILLDSTIKLTNYTKYLYSNYDITKQDLNIRRIYYQNSDIKEDDNIQIRLLFDNQVFSEKGLRKYGNLEEILDNNMNLVQKRNKIIFVVDIIVIVCSILLVIYFIYLVYKYDYQDLEYDVGKSYEEVLEEINPIVGACILQEREAENKDVLSLLLSLVNKKVLDLKVKQYEHETKYEFIKNKEFFKDIRNIENMNRIDKEVLDLFFYTEDYQTEIDIDKYKDKINLREELENIKINYRRFEKLKTIKNIINSELESIGANSVKLNDSTKKKNTIIMIISIIILLFRLIYKTSIDMIVEYSEKKFAFESWDNMYGVLSDIANLLVLCAVMNICLEFITLIIIWLVNIFEYLIKKIKRGTKKYLFETTTDEKKTFLYTTRNVMKIFQKYIVLIALILSIIYRFLPDSLSVQYIILVLLSVLIVVTDDYMKKHAITLNSTYIGLKMLEEKLINGSYLSEKDFQSTIIWDKYLAFSLALGFTKNEDCIKLLNSPIKNYFDEKKLVKKIFNYKLYVDLIESFAKRNCK